MVVLVNRKRHIFELGDTEVYCGMGSDTVSYWLQRRDRGARWTVLVRNEGSGRGRSWRPSMPTRSAPTSTTSWASP